MPNLFVSDGSLFPSSAAPNPTLTIVALALRLADHLKRHPDLARQAGPGVERR